MVGSAAPFDCCGEVAGPPSSTGEASVAGGDCATTLGAMQHNAPASMAPQTTRPATSHNWTQDIAVGTPSGTSPRT
jgi:hypothetical protein